jgi:hypothetical protein
MDVMTHAELRNLIEAGSPPRVSIFMPMHRTGRDVREDPIRLKDLLREAEKALFDRGIDKRTVGRILEPAQAWLEDEAFWNEREDGLAILLTDGFSQAYRLPFTIDERATVNDHFDLRPLLALAAEKQFYVLAVSMGGSRLLKCSTHQCSLVPLPADVALNMDQAIRGEDEHQTHTVRRGAGESPNPQGGAGAYHGQAQDIQQKEHEDLMFYLRQLDDGVRRVLPSQDVPLVLAGVDSVVPFYRKISSLRNLVQPEILGNPEHVANEVLLERAREMLEPVWHKDLIELQERFGTGTARGLSSIDFGEILEAAETGRVDILFVPAGFAAAGRYEDHPEHVHVGAVPGEDTELLERAVTFTLQNSGAVVPVLREQMPGNGEIAAIFRYATPQAQAV